MNLPGFGFLGKCSLRCSISCVHAVVRRFTNYIPVVAVKISTSLELLSEWSGRIAAWLVLLLVSIVVYDVLNRVIFRSGSVALQELEWHLFAIIFLIGSAYTLKYNAHVRLELFYQHFSVRTRAWIDLLGTLLFLLPLCLVVISSSLPFIYSAYHFGESSPDPGGLPYRFLIKSVIPLGFLLLFLQGIAIISQKLQVLMPKYRLADRKHKLKNDGDQS